MRERALTAAAIAVVFMFLLAAALTAGPEHDWGGDFAQYIHHARNLVTGRPYLDTGYVYNPASWDVGPPAYPPGTSWVLAPAYAAFGLDLAAFKVAEAIAFAAALAAMFALFRVQAGGAIALATIALVAANPYVWALRQSVISEYPFTLWVYLCLFLIQSRDRAASPPARIGLAVLAGAAAYLAYATRFVGVLLIAALVVHDLVKRRSLLRDLLPAACVFAAVAVGQEAAFGTGGGYADHLDAPALSRLADNAWVYANGLRLYLPLPLQADRIVPPVVAAAVAAGVLIMAARRYVRPVGPSRAAKLLAAVQSLHVQDLFMAGMLLLLVGLPFANDVRLLFPLIPLFVFYGLVAGVALFERIMRRAAAVASVAVAVLVLYGVSHAAFGGGAPREGVHTPDSIALFEAVRRDLPADAVVAFAKPRVMALFGERRSTIWSNTAKPADTWRWFERTGVTHLVVARPGSGLTTPAFLTAGGSDGGPELALVYENEGFAVYRIVRVPDGGAGRDGAVRPDEAGSRPPAAANAIPGSGSWGLRG